MNIDHYAVFGHPIGHSQSPRIHTLFAAQTGQAMDYRALEVRPESFGDALGEFFASGGKGLNLTVPLKELGFRRVDALSQRAQRAGAVNTVAMRIDGTLYGDNTDGIGLLRDLRHNLELALKGRRILLLGAGGASRGVVEPLLEALPEELVIANRTAEKAEQLAGEFAPWGNILGCGLDALTGRCFDLILNATSASLKDDLPPLPEGLLAPQGSAYDLAYGPGATAFVRWGSAQGARLSADGMGMLVEQAAEAFALWRGVTPRTAAVIEQLNRERGFSGVLRN
jgi:shikimate dehydrogenase